MIVLADTSIWIDHLRSPDERLVALLEEGRILLHPFVIGEIALGTMPNYAFVLKRLALMPKALKASDDQLLHLIRRHRLNGVGIGYVDAHLIASTLLMAEGLLWTRDKRLHRTANAMGIAFPE
ncbi:type II toxin-antitoxin system VapC family toxin [Ciceribacter selenitireducens]|uniref:PIN domain-containing protein n=1 Tax=Ciceribacter selenitireducens ATCC BAA-1503 TaxID=1336235 RepID=A0A376AJQ4_9HYPH|nr:unnamed protein product [Ciceribacter selenitireducens ATCC BAA-1503]